MSKSRLRGNNARSSGGFTLVEMLVAMAITLVMMAAVVTIFANVTRSVQKRRATIEMSTQLRHVRNVLQRDLAGATCPTLPWQRPESNVGYFELVEGPYSDFNPSMFTDGNPDTDGDGNPDELDEETSIVPRFSEVPGQGYVQGDPSSGGTTLNGLGDHDDILMFTTRNEDEPFVGRVPDGVVNGGSAGTFGTWGSTTLTSPLAEVVWFAVENPMDSAGGYFGEPGMRTVYRRTLIIAPWLNPYRWVDNNGRSRDTVKLDINGETVRTQPGVVRVLPQLDRGDDLSLALAALIAFQERYDLSVRLEFDPRLGDDGGYKIVANTLADLTKRENRYEHFYYQHMPNPERIFPFSVVSGGSQIGGTNVGFTHDPELVAPNSPATASVALQRRNGVNDVAVSYTVEPNSSSGYQARPFVFVNANATTPATARAILDDEGKVVHLTFGLAPLWGSRRGEDVMLTDALAFDLRVYDPGAPLYLDAATETIVEPSDPGWGNMVSRDSVSDNPPNSNPSDPDPVGAGSYVDLGYWNGLVDTMIRRGTITSPPSPLPGPLIDPSSYGLTASWYYGPARTKSKLDTPDAYRVYDTWSFHYENNGVNEDDDMIAGGRPLIDEGTNGFDDDGTLGVDDVGERETAPPYDRPLRGVQVKLRVFERDSQQIREVSVNQHFVPE